ncbi:MAG: hypothetical protein A3D94_03585 [Alphaproteobacteria bacterium RIFCSPHIGHO2_12_FULL_66_14]|nr:MAG: hypothetical protein A3D94_03585 [Alphaproteobacteria bacterium RIFCSPHIGHO2_12_FULL_66_14]
MSTIAFASLLCLGAAAHGQLKNENLLVGLPQGFKVGFNESRNGMNMQEWVPVNETVQNWTEMVTVQIFLSRKDLDPVRFLATMEKRWAGACKGSTATPAATGKTNGYASATTLLRCPLLGSSGKPETTMMKAIKGNDSFYLVQRAVRGVPTSAQLERTKQYLDGISVCDTRLSAHPCKM